MKQARARAIGVVMALLAGVGATQAATGGVALAAGGGMTPHVDDGTKQSCVYRPGQVIAPPGQAVKLRRITGTSVRELGSLVPENVKPVLPNTVPSLSLYDIGAADPFDTSVQAAAGGLSVAPNYLSSFAPGVRTWAPGEDASLLTLPPSAIAAPTEGAGLRIGVLDTGLNSKALAPLTGNGTVSYRSAASIRTTLAGRGLIASGYVQPAELGAGRAAGHGTFITGLLRRAVPGARLVVAQVPFYDANDALFGVDSLPGFATDQSSRADDAALTFMMYTAFVAGGSTNIDMLSLSFGSYGCGTAVKPGAGEGDFRVPIGIRSALLGLWELSGRTLRVAAAAGNDSTSEPFYPAAFAAAECFDPAMVPPGGGQQRCLMGTHATSPWLGAVTSPPSLLGSYSNYGPWAIVDARGSDVASRRHDSKWYTWSGTSFAAPCAALTAALKGTRNWFDLRGNTIDCGLGAPAGP